MWWSVIPTVIKTGAEIYKNHKQSELLESEAERRYFERMARGEIEYKRDVYEDQQKGWKDELVLIIVCLPIVLLAWSLFSGDPLIQQKLDLFFDLTSLIRNNDMFTIIINKLNNYLTKLLWKQEQKKRIVRFKKVIIKSNKFKKR